MNDGEIVERLRRHYDENVLEPKRDNNYKKLKKMLGRERKLAKWFLAERLNDSSVEEISEDDLKGAKIIALPESDFEKKFGFPHPPQISVKIPARKMPALMKKLGYPDYRGITLSANGFSHGPFSGTDFTLVPDSKNRDIYEEHETLHVLHLKRNRSTRDSIRLCNKTLLESAYEYSKRLSCAAELFLVAEFLAYGGSAKKMHSKTVSGKLKSSYVPGVSEYFSNKIGEMGFFPDCGAISHHGAEKIVEENECRYLKAKVDDGTNAIKILRKRLKPHNFARAIISIGPTREEFESGKYIRPIDELVLWSKHYKEVLKSE